ncbi:unnamed protein product [Ectocarpus fasciculatus]
MIVQCVYTQTRAANMLPQTRRCSIHDRMDRAKGSRWSCNRTKSGLTPTATKRKKERLEHSTGDAVSLATAVRWSCQKKRSLRCQKIAGNSVTAVRTPSQRHKQFIHIQ